MEIRPGTYKGKIVEYGISETKKGDPQAFITGLLFDGDKSFHRTWYGGFKPKSRPEQKKSQREITIKTLVDCGFRGTDIYQLLNPGTLDTKTEFEWVLDEHEYNGEKHLNVKFINRPYSVQNKLNKAGAVQKFSGLNLEGDLLQAQKGLSEEENKDFTADDIPF